MNFSHVVLLLVDGYGAICRFEEKGVEHSRILTRRELDLAGTILEEGRMLVIAPNKLDLLNQQQRHALVMALQEQVCCKSRPSNRLYRLCSVPVKAVVSQCWQLNSSVN
jgi:predicted GTPase